MSQDSSDLQQESPVDSASLNDTAAREILIVEDDADLAALLETWITGAYQDSVSVTVATSIDRAIERLGSLASLDIVLLDRRFPEGSGDSLLDMLHSRFDPIVVMITGVSPEEGIIRLPITDYLVKPIDEEGLLKRLSLLEKLEVTGVLTEYTDARKASLLEYHLEDPEEHPLFRRFAARWSYDRLEVADDGEQTFVYELYTGMEEVSVSVSGSLVRPLADLIASEDIAPVGELVPSGDGYAWIDRTGDEPVDPPGAGYAIYEFSCHTPEQHVSPGSPAGSRRLELALEDTYG